MPDGKKKTDEFFGEVDIYYFLGADVYLENNLSDYLDLKIKYQGNAQVRTVLPQFLKQSQ